MRQLAETAAVAAILIAAMLRWPRVAPGVVALLVILVAIFWSIEAPR